MMLRTDREKIFSGACVISLVAVSYHVLSWAGPVLTCIAFWVWMNRGV